MAQILVLMGVCGCGKSVIGEEVAQKKGWRFLDGDSLHPPQNVTKMSAGTPLNDEDRRIWLENCADQIDQALQSGTGLVLGCSALKLAYRQTLRRNHSIDDVKFVFLNGSIELIRDRMAQRKNHFMPPSLVDSQFATLESPEGEPGTITVDISKSPNEIVSDILARLE